MNNKFNIGDLVRDVDYEIYDVKGCCLVLKIEEVDSRTDGFRFYYTMYSMKLKYRVYSSEKFLRKLA